MWPSVYLALQAVLICAQPGCAPGGTQESHVDANIVARTEFDRILRRDLEAYFAATTAQPIATLDYQLLRDGPTQSGLAYPSITSGSWSRPRATRGKKELFGFRPSAASGSR